MKPSNGHLHLQLIKWRLVNERALEEDRDRLAILNTPSPPPTCLRRQAELYSAQDETSAAAGRIAAQFSTAKD